MSPCRQNCGVDTDDPNKVQCSSPDTLYAGESYLVELPLKITKATENAAGLVSFFHKDSDPDASNDTANNGVVGIARPYLRRSSSTPHT